MKIDKLVQIRSMMEVLRALMDKSLDEEKFEEANAFYGCFGVLNRVLANYRTKRNECS